MSTETSFHDELTRRLNVRKAAIELFYSFNYFDNSRNLPQNYESSPMAANPKWNERLSKPVIDAITNSIAGRINEYPVGTDPFLKFVASVLDMFSVLEFKIGATILDIDAFNDANEVPNVQGVPENFADEIIGMRKAKYAMKINTQEFTLCFSAEDDGELFHVSLDHDRTGHILGTVVRSRLYFQEKMSKARARNLVENIESNFRYLINKGKADKSPTPMAS